MLSLNRKLTKVYALDFQGQYIQNLIESRNIVLNSGIKIIVNKKTKHLKVSKANKKFIQTKLTDSRLKKAMLLTPKQQIRIINFIKAKLPSIHNEKTKIYQFLKYIFITNGYDQLTVNDKRKFYSDLKVNTCVYCNRNYIFDIRENGHIKGHIDHFYPKAKYPYFAMNYFNFIPVCESCNKVKSEFDTTDTTKDIIHPYERNDERLFSVKVLGVNDFIYKLKADDLLQKLHIEKIYNTGHNDIIQDLYIKYFQQDTKEYFDSLRKSLINIGFDENEIHRFISCGYLKNEDHHKRSMSKVIKDIREEFESLYDGK